MCTRWCIPSLSGFSILSCFFFNRPPPTDSYSLSLHDALPIYLACGQLVQRRVAGLEAPRHLAARAVAGVGAEDRKSTRLNSSHTVISYAVFCLKKKKTTRFRRDVSPADTRAD